MNQVLVVTMFLAASMCACAAQTAEPTPDNLKEEFLKHRRELLITNMDRRHSGDQTAEKLDAFLRELPDKADIHNDEEWRSALLVVISNSRQGHLCYRDTGYIAQECVVDLLVAGLKHPDREIQRRVLNSLTQECYQRDLARRSDAILEILKRTRSEEWPEQYWLLYGQLGLPEDERKQLARNRQAPAMVRARAGDDDSRKELIESFERAQDWAAKRILARELGYVGGEQCAAALARGLSSQVIVQSVVTEESIRLDVLLALGRIYQDEPLFTTDAQFLYTSSDRAFDIYRGLDGYVKDVNTWVKQHFGHEAWGQDKVWFKRQRKFGGG